MFLKITGCILLVTASSIAGFHFSNKLYKRRDFLKSFIAFITSLATNIRYNCTDIFTLVTQCANSDELAFLTFFETDNSPFESQWKKAIEKIPKDISLKKADKQLLVEFGSQLGKTDVDGQLKHMELYKINFSEQLSGAEEAIAQKSKLYKTMGFFAGTAFALMII